MAGQEQTLHLYVKCLSDTIVDTPRSLTLPTQGYEKEWIVTARDTSADGIESITLIEPDFTYYSATSLLLEKSYEDILADIVPCFSEKTMKRFSEQHVRIFMEMLVDDTGKVIESSQHVFSDTLLTDRRTLWSLAKLDRTVKREV